MCKHRWVFSVYKNNEEMYEAVCSRCGCFESRSVTTGIEPNQKLFIEILNKTENKTLVSELVSYENGQSMKHWERVRKHIHQHTEDSGL